MSPHDPQTGVFNVALAAALLSRRALYRGCRFWSKGDPAAPHFVAVIVFTSQASDRLVRSLKRARRYTG